MFRFENDSFLWALLLLPLLTVFFVIAWGLRKRALERFAEADLLPRLAPGLSDGRHRLKFGLLLGGLLLLVIAWANPQFSTSRAEATRQGIDIVLALDISESMLAEDIAPSRLERAKRFTQNLVDNLSGNNIAVEFFACNAFVQVPLTNDYNFVKLALNTADPQLAGAQGTILYEALLRARGAFREENPTSRAVILISDGEDHDGSAAETAEDLRAAGIQIYTIGVGTAGGGFIPQIINRRPDFLRNEQGEPVRTRLQDEVLRAVAAAGGGQYYALERNGEAIVAALATELERMEKQAFERQGFTAYDSYFQYFLFPGLLLLVAEFVLGYRHRRQKTTTERMV
jgi:Ca-activated chloride channel homolog